MKLSFGDLDTCDSGSYGLVVDSFILYLVMSGSFGGSFVCVLGIGRLVKWFSWFGLRRVLGFLRIGSSVHSYLST